jgi:deoxyribose-phosphate aldolase
MDLSREGLAKYIDHTALKPETTPKQVIKLCKEAREFGFKAVCVNPVYVPLAVRELKDTGVCVCTVVGFPLGAEASWVKAQATQWAVEQGAAEIDMVINIGWLKAGLHQQVKEDIGEVVGAAGQAIVKVIIECCLLEEEEKRIAATIVKESGARYVKTSTGFSHGGATLEDVKLLRDIVGPEFGVKAAGGIRSYDMAVAMIEAGATRLGISAGVNIIAGG